MSLSGRCQGREHRAAHLDAAIVAGTRQELRGLEEVARVDVLAEVAPQRLFCVRRAPVDSDAAESGPAYL